MLPVYSLVQHHECWLPFFCWWLLCYYLSSSLFIYMYVIYNITYCAELEELSPSLLKKPCLLWIVILTLLLDFSTVCSLLSLGFLSRSALLFFGLFFFLHASAFESDGVSLTCWGSKVDPKQHDGNGLSAFRFCHCDLAHSG